MIHTPKTSDKYFSKIQSALPAIAFFDSSYRNDEVDSIGTLEGFDIRVMFPNTQSGFNGFTIIIGGLESESVYYQENGRQTFTVSQVIRILKELTRPDNAVYAFAIKGFENEGTGGGCRAFTRYFRQDGEVYKMYVTNGDLDVPSKMSDFVVVTLCDCNDELLGQYRGRLTACDFLSLNEISINTNTFTKFDNQPIIIKL